MNEANWHYSKFTSIPLDGKQRILAFHNSYGESVLVANCSTEYDDRITDYHRYYAWTDEVSTKPPFYQNIP